MCQPVPARVASRDRPVHGRGVSLTEPESLSACARIGREMLVQASGLVKDYPRIRALDQVSMEIREGEVFGLFGPNGAGKTTCLRVLSGLTRPTGGQATVCGVDVRTQPNEVRKRLGILFDLPTPYEDMTVRDYLVFFARMSGIPRAQVPEHVAGAMPVLEPIPHQTLERSGPGLIRIGLLARRDAARIARALTEAGIDLLEMKSLGTMEDVYSRITVGTPPTLPGGAS